MQNIIQKYPIQNILLVTVSVLVTTLGIFTLGAKQKEHFTSPGYTLVRPPNWWFPTPYVTEHWLTPVQPDQISRPECMSHSRGNDAILNMNSYAYRMWRF